MIEILKTIKKLFDKRYSVVIFDSQNPPKAGDIFYVDGLLAEFRELDKQIKGIDRTYEIPNHEEFVWVCRKCGFREQKQ